MVRPTPQVCNSLITNFDLREAICTLQMILAGSVDRRWAAGSLPERPVDNDRAQALPEFSKDAYEGRSGR
jgi:hypothetical protein